jgi:hypothetical protein
MGIRCAERSATSASPLRDTKVRPKCPIVSRSIGIQQAARSAREIASVALKGDSGAREAIVHHLQRTLGNETVALMLTELGGQRGGPRELQRQGGPTASETKVNETVGLQSHGDARRGEWDEGSPHLSGPSVRVGVPCSAGSGTIATGPVAGASDLRGPDGLGIRQHGWRTLPR